MNNQVSAKTAYKMASQITRAKIRAEKSVFSTEISVSESNEMYATYRRLVDEFKHVGANVRNSASVAAMRCHGC